MRNGSVKMNVDESIDDDHKQIQRKKTPMQRTRKVKTTTNDEDMDENGIVDRDEDLFNDDDDVSTSTMHGSEDSLEEYIKEENKINAEKSSGFANGKIKKFKQFVADFKDKGISGCKNADNVISENEPEVVIKSGKDSSKSCSIM